MLLIFSAVAQAQTIRIESGFEPNAITLSRQAIYKVTVRGSQQSPEGSLPAVDGLSISGNPRVSRSASFINGVPSMRLDISFTANPTKIGTFTIPAWNLLIGGKSLTVPAATIRVLPRSQEDILREEARKKQQSDLRQAIFLETTLNKAFLYEGETIKAAIDLHVWERLPLSRLDQFPRKNGDAFSQSKLGRPIERRGIQRFGKKYIVYSWPVALTAAMEGMHELFYEMSVRIRVRNQRGSRSGNPFLDDPFFRDPFFGFGREESVSVTSAKRIIEVRSLPMQGRPDSFKGAIGTLSTTVESDTSRVTVGDPIRVTFTVSGRGNFEVMPAPEINSPENFKVGPPAFSFDGDENLKHEGSQRFEYVITPLLPGKVEIPEVPFSYFDPNTESYVESSGEPQALRVDPGETWVDKTSAGHSESMSEKPLELTRNLFQTESVPGEWKDSLATVSIIRIPSFWYAQIVPFMCFVGLAAWRVGQTRALKNSSAKRIAKLRNEMKAAANFNDAQGFFRAARGAISERVGELVSHEKPETLTRDEVIAILNQNKADEDVVAKVRKVLETSDSQEFAGETQSEIPLKEWFALVKRLTKKIRVKA